MVAIHHSPWWIIWGTTACVLTVIYWSLSYLCALCSYGKSVGREEWQRRLKDTECMAEFIVLNLRMFSWIWQVCGCPKSVSFRVPLSCLSEWLASRWWYHQHPWHVKYFIMVCSHVFEEVHEEEKGATWHLALHYLGKSNTAWNS